MGALAALAAIAQLAAPAPAPSSLVELAAARPLLAEPALLLAGGVRIARSPEIWRLPAPGAARVLPGLRRAGLVLSVTPDLLLAPAAARVDPDPLVAQEGWLAAVGADRATPPGPGKPVTIVDSGLDLTHPEFAGRANTTALNPQAIVGEDDFHGTAVASVVGAPLNGAGLVGVYPEAVIFSWDADNTGPILLGELVAGIAAAAEHGPGIVNLSVGLLAQQVPSLLRDAVFGAFRKGTIVVASAGNGRARRFLPVYPAAMPHVLTVAATDPTGSVASFSTPGPAVDLAAPGVTIPVALPLAYDATGYGSEDGTSFSAPIVAGAAAWVWTARPELEKTQLVEVLRRSARDIGPPGFDDDTGFGMLDIPAALAAPAPAIDPLEPNDDVDLVKPGGLFPEAAPLLTSPNRARNAVSGQVDALEDPRDVYRAWVGAGRTLTAALRPVGRLDLDLELWGPQTRTLDEFGNARRRDLLAESASRTGGGETIRWTNRSGRGVFVYVDALPAGGARSADYALTLASAAAPPSPRSTRR